MSRSRLSLRSCWIALAAIAGVVWASGEARACSAPVAAVSADTCCVVRPVVECDCCDPRPTAGSVGLADSRAEIRAEARLDPVAGAAGSVQRCGCQIRRSSGPASTTDPVKLSGPIARAATVRHQGAIAVPPSPHSLTSAHPLTDGSSLRPLYLRNARLLI